MPEEPVDQLVADIARDLVSETAPQELPLFRANRELFFKDPDKFNAPSNKDEMLDFGIGEVVVMLTPYLLAITREVIRFLADELQKSLKTESASLINTAIKNLFKKFRPPEEHTVPALTHEQLTRVRDLAIAKARELHLSDEQATLLADAVAGSLATS